MVCRSNTDSGWQAYFCTVRNDGSVRLWWWKPGTGSSAYLTTAVSTVAVNDVVRFEVTGTSPNITLELFVNGVSIASYVATNDIEDGYPGIGYLGSSAGTSGAGDDFEAGKL